MSSMQSLKSRQSGLSIIELMIALLLGSLLTVGLVQIFTSNSQAFRMSEALARSQEFGRIASEMLSRESRGAGYYGCNSQNVVNNLNIASGDDDWDLYNHASGDVVSSNSDWLPTGIVAGTDFLHFSGMEGAGIEITADETPTSATIKVKSGGGRNAAEVLKGGDVIAVTDCQGTDVIQVMDVSGSGEITTLKIGTGTEQSPGNNYDSNICPPSAGASCLSQQYKEGAQVLLPYKRTYFIGESTVRVGEPALKIIEYVGGSQRTLEMVEGVVDMQVRYGFSAEADEPVSDWKDAESVADSSWGRVRAVRVSLLVRGGPENLFEDKATVCFPAWKDCSTGDNFTAPDNRMYRVYSFTTNVRNSSS